jgi:hypothetical protein
MEYSGLMRKRIRLKIFINRKNIRGFSNFNEQKKLEVKENKKYDVLLIL